MGTAPASPRTRLRRAPQRGRHDRGDDRRDPRRGARVPPRVHRRRGPALRGPDAPRPRGGGRLRPRLGRLARRADPRRRRAGVPDRHARRRARAGAVGLPPLRELPLGGRARRAARRARGRTSACARSRPSRSACCPGAGAPSGRPTRRSSRARGCSRSTSARRRRRSAPAPPVDEEADLALDVWAGVLPLTTVAGAAEPDEHVAAGTPVPEHVAAWRPTATRR